MAGLWGDGFADDGFMAARAMARWEDCSPDEYVLLFPKLLPADGRLPAALRAHLEACVAVRAWRLARLDPATSAPHLRARAPAVAAADLHGAWFADDGAVTCLMRRVGLLHTSPQRVAAERDLLALLDGVLDAVQRGLCPAWSEDREAWLAFGSGFHPAYLWPESAIAPARGCAAAWLGHLDRGRTALLPEAVAEYLVDAVLDPSRPRDRALAAMVATPGNARRLRAAAAARLAGRDPAVRFGPGRRFPLRARRPVIPALETALEHA